MKGVIGVEEYYGFSPTTLSVKAARLKEWMKTPEAPLADRLEKISAPYGEETVPLMRQASEHVAPSVEAFPWDTTVNLAESASAALTVNGGSLPAGNDLDLGGYSGSTAIMNLSGGSVNVGALYFDLNGDTNYASNGSQLKLTGGTLTDSGGLSINESHPCLLNIAGGTRVWPDSQRANFEFWVSDGSTDQAGNLDAVSEGAQLVKWTKSTGLTSILLHPGQTPVVPQGVAVTPDGWDYFCTYARGGEAGTELTEGTVWWLPTNGVARVIVGGISRGRGMALDAKGRWPRLSPALISVKIK